MTRKKATKKGTKKGTRKTTSQRATTSKAGRGRKKAGLRGMTIPPKYRSAVAKAKKAAVGSQVWAPQEDGDAVAGKILSVTWREGRDKPYCTLVLDNGKETILVRPGTVLSRQLQEGSTRVGAEVVMVYRGSVPSATAGRPAKLVVMEQLKAGGGELVYDAASAPAQARAKAAKGRKGGK